jgi:hypothetical protein
MQPVGSNLHQKWPCTNALHSNTRRDPGNVFVEGEALEYTVVALVYKRSLFLLFFVQLTIKGYLGISNKYEKIKDPGL